MGDCAGELDPALSLCVELSFAFGREAVEAASPFAGFLDPSAFDEPLFLETIEQRVERRGVDAHDATRFLLEQLAQLVSVTGLSLEE